MAHPGTNQQKTSQQLDNATYLSYTIPSKAVNHAYTYTNIATSAQTVVKSGAGILGRIALNTTLVSAVRGYDNTVSGGNILFTIPAATAPSTFSYDVTFATGLVVSSGAGADNITVIYN